MKLYFLRPQGLKQEMVKDSGGREGAILGVFIRMRKQRSWGLGGKGWLLTQTKIMVISEELRPMVSNPLGTLCLGRT